MHTRKLEYLPTALCLVDSAASLLFGSIALWLALAGPTLSAVFVAVVWLWLAGILVGAFVGDMVASRLTEPRRRMWVRVRRNQVNRVAGIIALAAVAALLFSFGETAVAVAAEFLFFIRLGEARGQFDPPQFNRRPRKPRTGERWWTVRYEYFLMPVGALWVALGAPPDWAGSMIVAALWILSVWSIVGALMEAGESVIGKMWRGHADGRFRARFPAKETPRALRGYPPESKRHWLYPVLRWPYRVGIATASWALWTAGWPALAVVLPAAALCAIAWYVADRRKEFGPHIRIDAVARAIHALAWPPLKVVGAVFLTIFVVGLTLVAFPILQAAIPLYDRIVPYKRRQRAREAGLLEAADGAKLCRAFERPDGFIYFLYSSPRQYEHFMAENGVLRLSGLPVVARNWRLEVRPVRKETGAREFEEMPEGILLSYADFRTWYDGIPIVVVVPPSGAPSAHNFSGPYRNRAMDPDWLESAEKGLAYTITTLTEQGRLKRKP